MNKEQVIQLIEAYADAKASRNNYLIGLVAQQLSDVVNTLFPDEEQQIVEDVPKKSK